MTRTPLTERLTGIIAPAVRTLGVELWGVELASAGSRMVVRIYIDAPQGEPGAPPQGGLTGEASGDDQAPGQTPGVTPGVTIDTCARVSRHLGTVLEAEDAVPGAYVLEVSSPGLERRFFAPEQLTAYLGRTVDVRLHQPQDGRRHLRGVLSEAGAEHLVVDEDGARLRVEWPQVKTAHLVHEFPGASA